MKRKIEILLIVLVACAYNMAAQQDEYYRIEVGFVKTTHLTFPSKVKYVDLGSNYLIAGKADETENVVRVKAAYKGFEEETNFSVICEDGSFYTFLVTFNDNPETLYYEMKPLISVDSNRPVNRENLILKDIEGESPHVLEMIIRSIYYKNERLLTHLGERKDKIEATLRGIYVHNDIMYFNINMKNTSNVSYDIDYVKFSVQDKKKLKRTASQVLAVEPARMYNGDRIMKVNPKTIYRAVYAFQKFTISPDKILIVDIVENNGGRHIRFSVKHSDIISANRIINVNL